MTAFLGDEKQLARAGRFFLEQVIAYGLRSDPGDNLPCIFILVVIRSGG